MSDSKKIKAVWELKEQLTKLDTINSLEFDVWIVKTTQIIKTYLGDDSEFYTMMKNFSFTKNYSKPANIEVDIVVNIGIASDLLFNCIEYINNHGTTKKTNWIYTLIFRDWVLLFFTVLLGLFIAGWYAHDYVNWNTDQKQIDQLNNTVTTLRDSVQMLQDSLK